LNQNEDGEDAVCEVFHCLKIRLCDLCR
jgi:hypothetical protein